MISAQPPARHFKFASSYLFDNGELLVSMERLCLSRQRRSVILEIWQAILTSCRHPDSKAGILALMSGTSYIQNA